MLFWTSSWHSAHSLPSGFDQQLLVLGLVRGVAGGALAILRRLVLHLGRGDALLDVLVALAQSLPSGLSSSFLYSDWCGEWQEEHSPFSAGWCFTLAAAMLLRHPHGTPRTVCRRA